MEGRLLQILWAERACFCPIKDVCINIPGRKESFILSGIGLRSRDEDRHMQMFRQLHSKSQERFTGSIHNC